MTLAQGLKKLIDHARRDANFFHALVFDPEKVIGRLKYLDRKTKAALLEASPENLIRNMVPAIVMECGNTCGGSSCQGTCGGDSCSNTCGSSCKGTCSSSCVDTNKKSFEVILDEPAIPVAVGGAVTAGGAGRGRSRARARR